MNGAHNQIRKLKVNEGDDFYKKYIDNSICREKFYILKVIYKKNIKKVEMSRQCN